MSDANTISAPSNSGNPPGAIISLSHWLAQVGVTACTAWRWRKKGWLETVNIAGRQYLTRRAIEEFQRRASAGEFAQPHKVPSRKEVHA
jgi:predicted site-specific integrase-resolvase